MSDTCPCGTRLSRSVLQKRKRGERGLSGLCRPCWLAAMKKDRRCIDCNKPVTGRSTGRCHLCANRLLATDPAHEERRIALMREALQRPEVRARRVQVNRMVAERRMRWCPPERRGDYFRQIKKYGNHEQAKAAIRAGMTPFERQISLVLEGKAQVVPKLIIANREPERTLGGVSDLAAA